MIISKFSPTLRLSNHIREYLIIESEEAFTNTIIPDTYLAMAIRFRGNTGFSTTDGISQIPEGLISGIRNEARTVSYASGSANIIIAFKEGGIAAFSNLPAHELFNQSITADNIFPATSLRELTEKIQEASTHETRIQLLERFLISHLHPSSSNLLINQAVEIIRRQNGIIRIKELASVLHISQDPFEKKFRARIGTSPKKFASIIRIRNLISNIGSYPSLTDATYEAGFYDQSHFIKEFRHFTGRTPKDFFSAPQIW